MRVTFPVANFGRTNLIHAFSCMLLLVFHYVKFGSGSIIAKENNALALKTGQLMTKFISVRRKKEDFKQD